MNVQSTAETRRHDLGHFKAPKDTQVRVITALVVLLAVSVSVWQGPPASLALWAIVLGAAIFAPRGYTVGDATLFVHPLGYVGRFRNDLLGSYRALVVTPDEPAVFVRDVRAQMGVA